MAVYKDLVYRHYLNQNTKLMGLDLHIHHNHQRKYFLHKLLNNLFLKDNYHHNQNFQQHKYSNLHIHKLLFHQNYTHLNPNIHIHILGFHLILDQYSYHMHLLQMFLHKPLHNQFYIHKNHYQLKLYHQNFMLLNPYIQR